MTEFFHTKKSDLQSTNRTLKNLFYQYFLELLYRVVVGIEAYDVVAKSRVFIYVVDSA